MARSRAHLRLVPDPPVMASPAAAGAVPGRPPSARPVASTGPAHAVAGPDPLWRELLGAQLRARRHHRGERLADVAERAGVSPQYLSEVERGRKEPSSEMIAAIGRALGTDLTGLTSGVARELQRRAVGRSVGPTSRPSGPTALLRAA